MFDALPWLASRLAGGLADLFLLITTPSAWPDPSQGEGIVRIVYHGGSREFLFVVVDIALIVLALGLWRRRLLWAVVRGIEGLNNAVGRLAAWAALIMILQQVVIVVLQRIFRVSEITIGPFGIVFTRDLSWFGEELKLYNAAIVTLCAAYTFVQGGHVRVDLFYARLNHRGKRLVEMIGSLVFVLPFMTIVWLFGWYFLWRHLITPKVSATDSLELLERKARIVRWNVETIGFSPSGFDGYFLFKVLLVAFAALMFLQGIGHFYRSLLEYIEGPGALDKGKDLDRSSAIAGGAVPPAAADGAAATAVR